MTSTLTPEARAKALGLRTYRVAPDTYRVECVSKLCEHRDNDRWHMVTVGFDAVYDRCDCVHGIHLYRGTCHHRGAVYRRRDFKRPGAEVDALPTPECKELCRSLVPAGDGHANSCVHAEGE